ncbi:MAG TPA: DUF6519 domain-containing protein [Candidatus Limnocylindria bacterium]|nr:DUF6519 domain-containing protein [Candidatus Limnocylindria bacterium]
MKGDLSRVTFDGARYSRVVAQQGRVQLDADWNEQQAILEYRLRTALSDLFGHGALLGLAVAPESRAGFALHVHQGAVFGGAPDGIETGIALDRFGELPYSVELWFRPAAEIDAPGTIVSGADFRIAVDERKYVVFTRTQAGSDGTPREMRLVSRLPLREAGYAHVVCVFAGDAMEIWIDGKLDRRRNARRGAARPGGTVRIGAGYHGTIEQIAFWRRRRFRDDIAASFLRYDGTVSAKVDRDERDAGLVARWRADETAADALPRSPRTLCVGPGRCYVDGRLCEAETHRVLPIDEGAARRTAAAAKYPNMLLAYVDVWERYVSAYEDPALRDVALGGLDTTGRMRTIAQVGLTVPDEFDLDEISSSERDRGEIAVDAGSGILQDNLLYRFEVHEPGFAAREDEGDDAIAATLRYAGDRSSNAGATLVVPNGAGWSTGQYLQIVQPPGIGALLQIVGAADDAVAETGASFAVAGAPAELLGEQIAVRAIASLLWSRENGNLVFAIEDASQTQERSSTIVLRDEAARGRELRIDDVVVLADAEHLDRAQAGFVTTILDTSFDVPGAVTVTVGGRVRALGAGATLRKWDGIIAVDARNGSPAIPVGDLAVRCGETGYYRSGDYWAVTLRPDAPNPLDWPRDQKGMPVFAPPLGIDHTYAPLALIDLSAGAPCVVQDLRRIVPAVGDLRPSEVEMVAPDEVPVVPPEIPDVASPPAPAAPPRAEPPDGALVLAHRAPRGYAATGSVVEARVERLAWRASRPVPQGGAARAVAIDGVLYVLYDRGALLRRNPAHPDEPWETCRPYEALRRDYAVVACAGRLFVVGGLDVRDRPSRAVDVYDPKTDSWSEGAPLHVARARPIAAADEDGMFVMGGMRRAWFGLRYPSMRIERYDAADDRWETLEPMPLRRYGAAAVIAGSSVYVIGGVVQRGVLRRAQAPERRVDRWHLRTGAWTSQAPLHVARSDAQAVLAVDGEIVIAGGGVENDGAERLRIGTDVMQAFAAPVRSAFGLAAVDGVVYVIAGTAAERDATDVQECVIVERLAVCRRVED